jgi:SsrA-binding protein
MADNIKIISRNRRASHDYHLEEFYEAGLVLMGSEIKSIRAGHVNITEAFVQERNGELWVLNMYIAPYDQAAHKGHDPYRERKLLLHRREIDRITLDVARKGYTIVPTKIYLSGAFAKLEIALAKGKRQYDKRQDIKERDDQRRMRRALKDY